MPSKKSDAQPPWKRKAPKQGKAKVTLTPELIELARQRAQEAGRRYPNLVDNMWAAKLAATLKDVP